VANVRRARERRDTEGTMDALGTRRARASGARRRSSENMAVVEKEGHVTGHTR
jgi:hypothetical protein